MEWFTPENLATLAAFAVALASLLAAVLPDDSGIMKVVNWIALNIGKAKNDPAVQSKG